ncbi:Six-hairpin glycosidase [Glarea lozoyensis ATCC 20868]|uniref:Six-hairpin glycosidase n=1 Tax=Glarea lozoyensis (strain ATCC 20868 / MF5171) TaxID=1116229 RepID=S3D183_GLAL2|nr:Six-hairpin glycosidase [Glarea lozoyensis ATCC 20868]EPE31615.1 Six-hairpin glycosidase [Glarea lozoyensis ATCC 20868]
MLLTHQALYYLLLSMSAAADIDPGYNITTTIQSMLQLAKKSWEYGTISEAFLELHNPSLSVFSPTAFPHNLIPSVSQSTGALAYAKQYIHTNAQTLFPDPTVGDPASLGVACILLGQTDEVYLRAAERQAEYILTQAPRWGNGAISHRREEMELWADNVAMSMPFLAYLAVQQKNVTLMEEMVTQCRLYRAVLQTSASLNWQHIIGVEPKDPGFWSTGNGWACFGMVRVLHTLQNWPGSALMSSQAEELKSWIREILDGATQSPYVDGLLPNYLHDTSSFGEISGTALLTACAYRMAVNDPEMFGDKYVDWADRNRAAISGRQRPDGVFTPAANPYSWKDTEPYYEGSPEGQAFAIYLYTAYRDCVNAGLCQSSTSAATAKSGGDIGSIDISSMLDNAVIYAEMAGPDPNGSGSGPDQSSDVKE